MPGQTGSEKRRATERLPPLRLTPEQKALVRAYAGQEGATVAEYQRSRILQVPISRARRVPCVEADRLAEALAKLNRLGGNHYQLLRAVRFGGQFDPTEITAAEAEIDATCLAIKEALGRPGGRKP